MGAIYQNGVWYSKVGVHSGFTPVGTVISIMGVTAPMNYLACNGQVVNISDYPELALYFETQFGDKNHFGGDGVTTFSIPDLRGEFLRGTGTNGHTNQGDGADVGVHQDATRNLNSASVHSEDTTTYVSGQNVGTYQDAMYIKNADRVTRVAANTWITPSTISLQKNTSTGDTFYFARPTNTSVLYCIATKNIFMDAGSNYSTEEQVVGTWINGKPIYQKTFIENNPQATTDGTDVQTYINIGTSVDMIINIDKIGYIPEYGQFVDIPFHPTNQNYLANNILLQTTIRAYNNNDTSNPNTIRISNNRISDNNKVLYITIRYTKTTD